MALDWQVFLEDDGGGRTYLEWMFEAWGWTLSVAACAWIVAMAVGALMGTLGFAIYKSTKIDSHACK
jgi:glutamate/aspartate transport system permease protein